MLRTAYLSVCRNGANGGWGIKKGPLFSPPRYIPKTLEKYAAPYNLEIILNGIKFDFNIMTNKRKSLGDLQLICNRKSINIAENNNKAPTYTIQKDILNELEKRFPTPKQELTNFYRQVAQYFKDQTYFLSPQYIYDEKASTWTCTVELKWPEKNLFKYSAPHKKEASHYASLTTLHYLIKNDFVQSGTINKAFTKKDISLLSTTFPDPVNLVDRIYCKVAYGKSDSSFILNPIYDMIRSIKGNYTTWDCTINVKWPEEITFTQNSGTKLGSIKLTAYSILKYLTENNRLDKLNLPILNSNGFNNNSPSVLNYNLLSDTGGIIFSPQIRSFATEVKKRGRKKAPVVITNIENNEAIEDVVLYTPEEIDNLKKSFNYPKHILNNVYLMVSQELKDKTLTLSPIYQSRTISKGVVHWQCIYHLKWPKELQFAYTSKSKQEASDKAALLALDYLRKHEHINNRHQPNLLNNVAEIKKSNLPAIYMKPDVLKNMSNIIQSFENDMVPYLVKATKDDDDLSVTGDLENEWPEMNKMHMQKFRGLRHYMMKDVTELPITAFKDNIIETVKNNQVVIIKGEPGCGKSTRVPQYVLEGWASNAEMRGNGCRIIITQPRRIAAISLADRVASERRERVGETVGYQVRFKTNFDRRSGNILYCTTGILLRRLQTDPNLTDCSHIILDEAHERDVNTDLLLNLLRSAIKRNSHLKLLVMSATIDAEVFQEYFQDAAVIHIPGFTFPVKVNFLDNTKMLDKTMAMCESNIPAVIPQDVAAMIKYIHKKRDIGAILCFLPGWDDIAKVRNLLPQTSDMFVICLHSRIQDEDQRKIYSKPPPGVRKVILSTNIAETSVTVDDVKYIIDTGIQKEKRFDVEKGIVIMDNHWISKASMTQRKGRAGRVSPGESFHLYPESKFNDFNDYSLPDILRTSLTKIVLDCKVYSNNMPAKDFLSELLSPPKEAAVEIAVDELKSLELLDADEKLTPLGRVLSNFQLEPKLGKAMVNSVIFKCVTPVVDIVTLFSAETELFAGGLVDKESINKYKKEFSKSSDHLSLMRLFEKWLEYVENEDYSMAERFCRENDLVNHKLGTIQKLREIHFDYLRKGLLKVLPISDGNSDNDELVKAVMFSGVGTVLQHRNYDIVKGRMKKSNVLLTRNNHKATITSDSVNFKRSEYPSKFLMYINETRSDIRRITLVRETSLISPIAVLLFKNNKLVVNDLPQEQFSDKIKSQDQVRLKLENTKIEFICDRQDAILLEKCKTALNSGIQYYTYQLTKGSEYDKELNLIWDDILLSLSNLLDIETV